MSGGRAAELAVEAAAAPGDTGLAAAAAAAVESAALVGERVVALRCAWCGRWRGSGGRWLLLEEAASEALIAPPGLVSHGMCPACSRRGLRWAAQKHAAFAPRRR